MRVFVTGGTGYVGQAVVNALLQSGHQVTALQRPSTPRPLTVPVDTVAGDLFSPSNLAQGMEGCEAIVHLVGIIRELPRQNVTMSRIHVDGTQALVRAAKAAGIRRFLHMSALGARPKATSKYHQSKWAAEEVVRHADLDYTIFRPSVIYGDGGPGPEFLGQLIHLIRSAPFVPIIGRGTYKLQPIALPVLCDAFVHALQVPQSIGRTYELGGKTVVSYEEILRRLTAREGKTFRPIHIPESVMNVVISLLGRFSWFPITIDQFIMLKEGNVCQDGHRAVQDLNLNNLPFTP